MMKTRHTPKTASCLYMLGFASGLLFIVLCGSSTIYEEFVASLPNHESHISAADLSRNDVPYGFSANEKADAAPVPLPLGQLTVDFDISFTRSDAGSELSILGLGFNPGERVTVSVMSGTTILVSQDVAASEVGGFSVKIMLPPEAITLTEVTVVASSESNNGSRVFPLPGSYALGTGIPTSSPTPTPERPTCTYTAAPLPTVPSATPQPPPTQTPTPTATPFPQEVLYPNWRAEFFNNPFWQGTPEQKRDDPVIAFDWGEDSPVPGAIGQNWFSVRWTRRIRLPEGYYDFVLSADDQAEVLMNGERILNYIGDGTSANRASFYVHGPEPVEFVVLYAEFWGSANIHFYWEQQAGRGYWNLSYYRSPQWSGDVVYQEIQVSDDLRMSWKSLPTHPIWQFVGFSAPFSALVTRQLQAPYRGGDYYLCVLSMDSVRMWLDKALLAEAYMCRERGCFECIPVSLRKRPPQNLSIEFDHIAGGGILGAWSVPRKDQEPWIGAFYDNVALADLPRFLQTTSEVDYNWGLNAPDPRLPTDQFSIRWVRTMVLTRGQHRFYVEVDDGARLRINDKTMLDVWFCGSARQYEVVYDVLADKETLDIQLDYFEQSGLSSVKFWHVAPTPTPTTIPTVTPTPVPLPTIVTPTFVLPCVTNTPCCVTPIPGTH